MMGKILDEVAPTMRSRVKFVKVCEELAAAGVGGASQGGAEAGAYSWRWL